MENRIVRLPEVCAIAGVSASTIARLERAGLFPARVRLSRAAIGFRYDEIVAWVHAREPVVATKEVKRGPT